MAVNIGAGIQGIGDAATSLFGAAASGASAQGDVAEEQAYEKASSIALENAGIVKQSTAIQETQATRQIFQGMGSTSAALGAANLEGGSAGDLMRSGAQQGALTKQLIQQQGDITQLGYEQEASSYTGMANAAAAAASAAKSSEGGGIFGGLLKIVGAGISFAGL